MLCGVVTIVHRLSRFSVLLTYILNEQYVLILELFLFLCVLDYAKSLMFASLISLPCIDLE
ncbi:hypothetical protein CFP56_033300 [Quercus suber]|uniref:Uncharacterized protein n=1 Tax=Quercus suber TaxID=58331 RepID=A0AAW0MBY8_QUESU